MMVVRAKYWVCLVGIALVAVGASQAEAQGQRGRPGFGGAGGPGGFGGFGGGPLELLSRQDVQKELGLLDEQVAQLDALRERQQERQRERFRDLFGGLRGGNDADRDAARERIREAMEKANEELRGELDQVLLPHQSKRLAQLEMQRRLRGGAMAAIANPEVAEQLGISDAQREQLREKAEQAEAEFRQKLAALRKEMQDDLLTVLSAQQRAQFTEMVGEPFEFQDEPRRGGEGGRGGFGGGFGGGRGGRGGGGGGERPRRPDAN